jgi:hypothetical protein
MTVRPRDNLNRALALLERGDFASGWPLYEARINHPDWSVWAVRDSIARHRNRLLRPGDSLAGRDILVVTEQGLGDNIMFARYVPLLAARGARVTLACSPALRPIFERVEGIYELLSPPSNLPIGKLNLSALHFDGFAPLLSLPYLFGTIQETIPVEVPYLHIETARVGAWRKRYAVAGRSGCLRVGLVAQANPESRNVAERSMQIDDLLPLLEVTGVDLVNLQHGPAGRALAAGLPAVIDATAEPMPLDEFAAAIAATDLLISVDTMAVHCSGAMGHPVWVALPVEPNWFWEIDRSTCRWYPSAELFRPLSGGGWNDVVADLCSRLRTLRSPAVGIAALVWP